jgi:O-antigen/teichoic acid export membrane protein
MSLRRNSIFNLAGLVVPVGLSLLTVPAYIHLIGLDRYGVLAIAWLLLGYFGMFDLGLGRATIHRIAELRDAGADERRTTFHTAIVVNLFVGVLGGLLLAFGAGLFFDIGLKVSPALRQELSAAAPLLGLSLPVATLTGVLTGALQGRERFVHTNAIGILSTILFQLAPLFVAWQWGPNMSALLLAGLAARAAALIVFWVACNREFGWTGRLQVRRDQAGPLLKFGGWVTVAALMAPFLSIIDRFAIGAVIGATAVAFYSVPYQLTQRIAIIPTALTAALFPRLSAMTSADEIAALSRDSMLILAALITGPVLFAILLAAPALTLWLGQDFAAQATLPAELLLIAFWFNALALLPFTVLQAKGRPQTIALIFAIELVPYLAALYIGMSYFGLAGCAAAFALRCALDYALLSIYADRRMVPLRSIATAVILLGLSFGLNRAFDAFSLPWIMSAALLMIFAAVETWRTIPPQMMHMIKTLRQSRSVRSDPSPSTLGPH